MNIGIDVIIIASELDYVKNLVDSNENFNPYLPSFISRSVKRFLAIKEVRESVLTSEQLFKEIF